MTDIGKTPIIIISHHHALGADLACSTAGGQNSSDEREIGATGCYDASYSSTGNDGICRVLASLGLGLAVIVDGLGVVFKEFIVALWIGKQLAHAVIGLDACCAHGISQTSAYAITGGILLVASIVQALRDRALG